MIKGPLNGIRVLDLTKALAGPLATQILGDLGAEVIKIEATPDADGARGHYAGQPSHKGENFYFLAFNRNKKSVSLDLRTPSGRRAFLDLVEISDIVAENFRPGSMDNMGLGYEDLKKVNPRIIMWQNTGFGDTGPYKDRPCYEVIAQGYSGMLDLTRESPERPPVRSAAPLGDMASGLYGVMGILAALHECGKTGQGQVVKTSMIGVCMAMMCYHLSHYFLSHEIPKAVGSGHLGAVPIGAYKCKDDYVVIAGAWPRICRVVGMEWAIDDPRFATLTERLKHKDEFNRILEEHLAILTAREWLALISDADIPVAPVYNLQQAVEDPHVKALGIIKEIEHPLGGKIKTVDNPIKMTRLEGEHQAPPTFSQHTEEILRNLLGYSDKEIKQLRKEQEENKEVLMSHVQKLR